MAVNILGLCIKKTVQGKYKTQMQTGDKVSVCTHIYVQLR